MLHRCKALRVDQTVVTGILNPVRKPKRLDEYDDQAAVRSYLDAKWSWYMTDFEKRCQSLAARRAKALLDPTSDWSKRVQTEWERFDDDVRAAIGCGIEEFTTNIRDRVLTAFRDGSLVVNRCPRCRRVVETPLARQCLWCGHDWHA